MHRTSRAAPVAALLLSALFAYFSVPLPASAASYVNVSVMDNFFAQKNITISAGDTVVWRNNGSMSHTVTADNGSFDSGTLQPGQTYTQTFTAPGVYTYHCIFHGGANGAGMAGTITVTQPQQPAPQPAQQTGGIPNQTSMTLAAQAQALLARVMQLQQQLSGVAVGGGGTLVPAGSAGGSPISSANCPRVGGTLRPGSSGDDVSRLQQYLAQDPSVYPEGIVSGFYGPLTQRAVERWQIKYNIVSSGSPETTGFGQVGPRTATAIALQCSIITGGGGSGGGGGNPPTANVGGFIQVTPASGNAPLNVTVQATVNTVASCDAVTYMLDWGDGSPQQSISVPANACDKLVQSYNHIYNIGGGYTIALSAGQHRTTASIAVTGPVTTEPPPPKLPAQTFTASLVTGTAPLRVTFSGVVTGANAAWCESGCTNTLDFGDGTADTISLPASKTASQTYSVQHTYANKGTFRAVLYQGESSPGVPIVGTPISITVNAGQGTGDNYPYGPLGVTPGVNGNPLSIAATFDLPSACTGFKLSWGDGSSDITQNDGGTSCAQTPVTRSYTHQYEAAGAYDVSLDRGATLSRHDTASVAISY